LREERLDQRVEAVLLLRYNLRVALYNALVKVAQHGEETDVVVLESLLVLAVHDSLNKALRAADEMGDGTDADLVLLLDGAKANLLELLEDGEERANEFGKREERRVLRSPRLVRSLGLRGSGEDGSRIRVKPGKLLLLKTAELADVTRRRLEFGVGFPALDLVRWASLLVVGVLTFAEVGVSERG
jgi:hypothetical protein